MTSTFALAITALVMQAGPSQNGTAELKASLAQNQTVLRQYTWIETTETRVKGEVKKQEQKQCYYGADGKVQKTPLPGASAPPPQPAEPGGRGGRLKKKIVENKVDELKDYMGQVAALVHEYVPPDPQKVQAAEAAGNVSAQPASGALKLDVKNYAKPGDDLAIGFDTASKTLTSYSVSSYVQKPKDDDVTMVVTFGKLADGTSYPKSIVLDVKAKKIQVTVTNSGYRKSGPS
jgi:hypothetical protein